ncbi:hypothetical protein [Nakamurella panacisegetis]|uniref:hypothetical protein n=1 Tax=Nakamurella panacisegetis TaxID=1090615 RepID=UPI0012FD2DD2|nr:hypothetical protein [Nakamurella panacisegetis]
MPRQSSAPAIGTRATAVGLLGLTIALLLLTAFEVDSPIRLLVTLLFALTTPGWALAAYLTDRTPAIEWTIATCASIAIVIVVSMTMLVLHAWQPVWGMSGLAVVTAGVLLHHVVRSSRVRAPEQRP